MICRTVSSAALSRSIGRQGRDFWSLRTNKALIVELKSVSQVLAIHEAQLMTYLKLSGVRVGLLINFNVEAFKGWHQTLRPVGMEFLFVSFEYFVVN